MRDFKSYSEEIRCNKDIPRLEDFSYKGKLISKERKNIGTEKIIDLASELVNKKIRELGIKTRKFDKKRITFLIPVDPSRYESEIDYILMREDAQAAFGEIQHEIIHYLASEWHINDHNYIENKKKQKMKVKGGFHNIAFSLDEAITEKTNRDIISENIEAIKSLIEEIKIYFDGIYEERLLKFQSDFELQKISASKKIDKYRKEYASTLKKNLIEENQIKVEDQKLFENLNVEENVKNDFIKEREESFERRKNEAKKLYHFLKDMEMRHICPEKKKILLDMLKKDYSFNDIFERGAYDYQLSILDLLLDGVAYSLSNNQEEFEKNKEKVWEKLQKDYFNTNNWGLRIFDHVFGKGTLRELQQLSIQDPKHNIDFIKTIEETVKKIKEKNLSSKK